MTEEWARNRVAQIRGEADQRRLRDAKALSDRELMVVELPKKWAALRELLRRKVEAFNAEYGSEVLIWESIRSNEVIVRIKDSETTLHGRFGSRDNSIELDSGPHSGCYDANIVGNEVVLRDHYSSKVYSIEEIAEGALDNLLTFLPAA